MTTRPLEIDGIDHVVLQVTNVERSLQFYVGVLGLSLERVIEDLGVYQVRCGRNLIDLMALPPGATLADKSQRGIDHLCLHVRGDMNQVVEYLRENGVELGSPLRELYGATGFGTSVYVFDPDRHMIELKANHSQYPVKTNVAEALGGMTRPKSTS